MDCAQNSCRLSLQETGAGRSDMKQSFVLQRGERDLTKLVASLSALDKDKPWRITIEEARKERSDLQNRALWGVAYATLRDATGNDPEDLHAYFCGEYWGWVEYDVLGQTRKKPRRTTTRDEDGNRDVISTLHLSDFYSFIQQRAAETVGVYVPDPDPEWWQHQEKAA